MSPPQTAAALVIGNELLTGKVQDANVHSLAQELFRLGIALQRVVVCADEVDVIVEELNALRRRYDLVFTSGGVGPTHDDVTLDAVAGAFDRQLVRSRRMEALLRDHLGERCSPHHLRMARVPEGAELVADRGARWPVLRVGNVFVLPGLPEVFRRKLPILRRHLEGGEPFVSVAVETVIDEGELAPLLEEIHRRHPAVSVGSYPRWGDGGPSVRVTFDGRDAAEVERAAAVLRDALGSVAPPARVREDGGAGGG